MTAQHTGTKRCCAECKKAYQRDYMRARRAARPEIKEAERLAARARYRRDVEAGRDVARRWRARNPDAVRAQNARRDPEDRRREWQRYYAENAEQMRERSRRRRQTHPEDKRRYMARRKAIIRRSAVTLTAREIEEIRSRPCLFCGKEGPNTLAHDVPVSRGGETSAANCFSLCAPCNSRMGTRTLEECRSLRLGQEADFHA